MGTQRPHIAMYRQKTPTYLVVSGQSARAIRRHMANLYQRKYLSGALSNKTWADLFREQFEGVVAAEFVHDELEVVFETEPYLMAFVLNMRSA